MTDSPRRPHRGPFKFNLSQSRLETARGALKAAALAAGAARNAELATELWRMAIRCNELRDPQVQQFYAGRLDRRIIAADRRIRGRG